MPKKPLDSLESEDLGSSKNKWASSRERLPKKGEDLNNLSDSKIDMATRRIINGKAYEVRERSTSRGNRGTIIGKWSSSEKRIVRDSIIKKLFE